MPFSMNIIEDVFRVVVLAETTILLYYSIKTVKEEYKRLLRYKPYIPEM